MINLTKNQLEKEIVSIFKKHSSGNPRKINLNEAFSCIQNSSLLPAGTKKQELIEEFYLRQYDVKFSLLSNVLSRHGGRKMSCNPPGGLDAHEYIGKLSEDNFKDLALVLSTDISVIITLSLLKLFHTLIILCFFILQGMHFLFKYKAKTF